MLGHALVWDIFCVRSVFGDVTGVAFAIVTGSKIFGDVTALTFGDVTSMGR